MKKCENSAGALPTWDLEAIYPDAQAWEEDFAKLEPLVEKFAACKGRLAESAETFRTAIECNDAADQLAEKLYVYAHLRSDEDTSKSVNRARLDRISAKFAELSPLEAWFEPEVMAIPDERMAELLAAPELAFYKRSIEELLREKKHTLSETEERLLGVLSDVLGASDEIFSTLNDTDMRFGRIKDEKGKMVTLSHGSYGRFLENPDRRVRRAAFKGLYRRYGEFRNTLAATLDSTVKRHVASAKIRHFDTPLQAALHPDNVPEKIYTNLISTVRANLDGLFDYFRLRADRLGLEKLNMYDLHTPLVPECRSEWEFAAASDAVQKALRPLGEEYGRDLLRAWSERWIDAPERPGKRSGAYSSGCYDTRPYLLLNYQGTLNDVFTLAHELGHSMHSFYSHKHQHFHYASYEIFVAEVASITNELLLSQYMLDNSDDPKLRAYIYGHMADEMRTTLYRQTMFAEFENFIHQASFAGEPLTADFLCENYFKLNADYHGPAVEPDKEIALEWSRIPHFYYNFYVYKYATGMAAAVKLSRNLLSGDQAARDAYLGFLGAGSSKDVLDILKDAGVDLSTPAPIEAALAHFREITASLRRELERF